MSNKLKVAVLFGGQSPEHEISIMSAENVINALDLTKYNPLLIKIDKEGGWHQCTSWHDYNPRQITIEEFKQAKADVVVPVVHGLNGEDGTLQGFLETLNIPYVGAGVLSSAICMDKDIMKRLLQAAELPVAKFLVFKKKNAADISFDFISKTLGLPFFVKPATAGSSIGISKVKNAECFIEAINEAFKYDIKIIIEECITGREIELSVLGNNAIQASLPGEIIPQNEFYTYADKYLTKDGAILKCPAVLSTSEIKAAQQLAIQAFEVLECQGMARVDLFLSHDGQWLINELNTIPGFTNISMYPKLWEISGLSNAKLMDSLIDLAMARKQQQQTTFTEYKALCKTV